MTIFIGTLPVRPYHHTQFFGTIKADGQLPKVAALACHHQEVVAISLVGYDTSVSAALSVRHCQVVAARATGL